MVLPADEDATLPLYPGERSARPASVACNGLAVADLAWVAILPMQPADVPETYADRAELERSDWLSTEDTNRRRRTTICRVVSLVSPDLLANTLHDRHHAPLNTVRMTDWRRSRCAWIGGWVGIARPAAAGHLLRCNQTDCPWQKAVLDFINRPARSLMSCRALESSPISSFSSDLR